MSPRTTLFDPIEPTRHGHLDVGDGHRVYWEECGNPDGHPVVVLHGGPGAGCSPLHRRLFDPARYRIVLLDQRGCGRSTPHVADDASAALSANSTWDLVADLERLREHLDVVRWQVFGGSWGSTLALAYAETHPDAVEALTLRGVYLFTRGEVEWFLGGGASWLYPQAWAEVHGVLGGPSDTDQVLDRMAERLADPDPLIRLAAAQSWAGYEAQIVTAAPRPELVAAFREPREALALASIEHHFMRNGGWFRPDQLIDEAGRLADVPTVIVQGRHDTCTPARAAWQLSRAMPHADLRMVEDAGHAFDEPGILRELLAAPDRLVRERG